MYGGDGAKGKSLTKMPYGGDNTKDTMLVNSWYDIGEEGHEVGNENLM